VYFDGLLFELNEEKITLHGLRVERFAVSKLRGEPSHHGTNSDLRITNDTLRQESNELIAEL